MTWFMQSKHLAVVATFVWATTLAASPAAAQQPDSATINGTIYSSMYGNHTWTLTLQGLSYSHDFVYLNYMNPDVYYAWTITRVYAASFDFKFQGPYAGELNANVSDPLVSGGLQAGPFVELRNYTYWNNDLGSLDQAKDWVIEVKPIDFQQGLHFDSASYSGIEWPPFATDANGYPALEPFTSFDALIHLTDNRNRPGSGYSMGSLGTVSVSSVGFSLPGDYNHDGEVDASDYVMWRNSPSDFGGDPGGYNAWRNSFGRTSGSGAAMGATSNNTVPEPGDLALLTFSVPALLRRRLHSL